MDGASHSIIKCSNCSNSENKRNLINHQLYHKKQVNKGIKYVCKLLVSLGTGIAYIIKIS